MEKNGLTAKMLSQQAGISVNTLNMYLGYRETMPSADIAVKLAHVLGVTVEYLIDGATLRGERKRESDFDIVSDSRAERRAPPDLSAFVIIVEEIKKTPKERLPDLLELVIKFNKEHKADTKGDRG